MPEHPHASPVGQFVAQLAQTPQMASQIAFSRLFPSTPPEFGQNRRPWPAAIIRVLEDRGIRLYSHQARATDYIRAGRSVVVATPTASGKSLIYNLPVLEAFLKDPECRALYLFPLKALAQDQLGAFNSLTSSWVMEGRPQAALYDGDTNDYQRRKIRADPPCALLSNPEMLHLSLLPHHEKWATFLANLNYVIVDEAHTYRGMFGSHMAQVFRRLNRITNHYGISPTYIFCTATLGNPRELAANLLGAMPELIDKSGAPQGARHFIFVNPETATSTCVIDVLKQSLALGLRTIVYCKTRRLTELISIWAGSESGPWRGKISAYRAGFLPEERRKIEADMASGKLAAVVSTSALELGIDIGGLDVCILAGYPGTIMQTLQRGGRVGRAMRESAVVVVAGEDALDQYFMRHPEDFFSRTPEKAVINPDNEVIVARHLECAASELPLDTDEPWLRFPGARNALNKLRAAGLILPHADGFRWLATRKRPEGDVDLRGSGKSYHIEDVNGNVIGTIDGFRAWRETHPGAVYIHHGKSWIIEEIDDGRMRILARAGKMAWFTRVRFRKETEILETSASHPLGRCPAFRGRLRITETITGYEKRSVSGNKLLGITRLEAPPQVFETDGMWIVIPDPIRQMLEDNFIHFMGSIHAMEHAVIGALPLEVMADRNDFGGISTPIHIQLGMPAVFIYDSMPGGAGLTASAFENYRHLLEAAQKMIADCACEDGCPSCVQSPKCGSGNRPLEKKGALILLKELLAPGNEAKAICESLGAISAPRSQAMTGPEEPPAPPLSPGPAPILTQTPVSYRQRSAAAHLPPKHYAVFDVETRRSAKEVGGWDRARDMGVSVAVLYDSVDDKFFTYGQDELEAMFEKMAAADLVIGFNSLRFDYKVLEPFAQNLGFSLRGLRSLDLLQRIHERLNYRVSLDNLGQATLNSPKSADGLQALKWWKEGRIAEIAEYCGMDVQITRDLYLHGLRENYLLYSNKRQDKIRVDVDFSTRF